MATDLSAFLALAAAFSWTLAGIFGHKPAVVLGSLQFNRIRMIVSMLLILYLTSETTPGDHCLAFFFFSFFFF